MNTQCRIGDEDKAQPMPKPDKTLERFNAMVDRKKERMANDVLCNPRYKEWELSHK